MTNACRYVLLFSLFLEGAWGGYAHGQDPAPEPAPPAPAPEPSPEPPIPVLPLAIEGPDRIPSGAQARLQLTGTFTDADWEAIGIVDGGFVEGDGEEYHPSGSHYIFTGQPGSYRVRAMALVGGRIASRAKVVVIDPTPVPPGPGPGPTPNPTPDPIPGPTPNPAPDPEAGLAGPALDYSRAVRFAAAHGYDLSASAIESGKTMKEAVRIGGEAATRRRSDAFTTHVQPAFALRLPPEGQEPKTQAERAAIASTWREFAKALRGER